MSAPSARIKKMKPLFSYYPHRPFSGDAFVPKYPMYEDLVKVLNSAGQYFEDEQKAIAELDKCPFLGRPNQANILIKLEVPANDVISVDKNSQVKLKKERTISNQDIVGLTVDATHGPGERGVIYTVDRFGNKKSLKKVAKKENADFKKDEKLDQEPPDKLYGFAYAPINLDFKKVNFTEVLQNFNETADFYRTPKLAMASHAYDAMSSAPRMIIKCQYSDNFSRGSQPDTFRIKDRKVLSHLTRSIKVYASSNSKSSMQSEIAGQAPTELLDIPNPNYQEPVPAAPKESVAPSAEYVAKR